MVCMDYVSKTANNEPVSITLDYVKTIIERYFSIVKSALEKNYIDNRERDLRILDSITKAKGRMAYEMDRAQQQQEQKDAIKLMDTEFGDDYFMKENVISTVRKIYPNIPEIRISKIFDDVYSKCSKKEKKEEPTLTQKVISKLIKQHIPRKIKRNPSLSEQTKAELEDIMKNHTMNPNIDPDSML